MSDFAKWFEKVTGNPPHPWQDALGTDPTFGRRLIRIPTGFGKTLGVLLTWAYHRLERGDDSWPRRLAWCLPMRVLVEQTHDEARGVLDRIGVLWPDRGPHDGKVGVHLLMGGSDAGEWHLFPEECAILIGTQDMLLSRALNRGYGAARGRWPMDFGLLNQDCLWVLDEVQLMDVGLATSAQLEAFRMAAPCARPTASFWMSATLQPTWLNTRDTASMLEGVRTIAIPPAERSGTLWEVTKPCSIVADCAKPAALAKRVADEHLRAGLGEEGPTLVVVNTVDRAVELAKALRGELKKHATDVRLVHSRFRPAERAAFRDEFLNRAACGKGTNRVVVATQVIEAGVDMSAGVMFSDVAPWPSLVQRFGRAARWGGSAKIFVVDTSPKDDKAALPYTKDAIDAARSALEQLDDVSPMSLERFEESAGVETLANLYPYEPASLLLRDEVDELFDTTPDLTGADLDISRFIRSGDERDLSVFWAEVPADGAPSSQERPRREALCPVPFLKAREWLCGKARALVRRRSAWIWSFVDGGWRQAEARDLYPGQTVLVDRTLGGYDWDDATNEGTGWSPKSTVPVSVVGVGAPSPTEEADAAQDDEALSEMASYRTIGTHGTETGQFAAVLASHLCVTRASVLTLSGRLHDVGKAHAAFQASMCSTERPARDDLAKAPISAWLALSALYPMPDGRRRGFRHELASALAMFAILARHAPGHPALLGRWQEVLAALGENAPIRTAPTVVPSAIERDVLALSEEDFDLVAFLVASHHGKVRASMHATPADQDATARLGVVTIRGLRDGDALPPIPFGSDADALLPATTIDLSPASMGLSARTGASWADRVLGLVARLGPFQLAWLEALLRAADVRASRLTTPDPMLQKEGS